MAVESVQTQSDVDAFGNSYTTKISNDNLTNEDFLTLLLEEMKQQDPTSPMDSNRMLDTQMQMSNIQTNLDLAKSMESLQTSYSLSALSTAANVIGKNALGMHFAGVSNTVNGQYIGSQFAGISNAVNGNVLGAQVAGISNISNGDFTGLQLSGISNIAIGDVTGAQMGLINTAKNVTGFQLGLINVAESFEKGVPLGLISFVKDGFHAIEVSGGESIYGNLSLKMGVDKLYTIYRLGYAANNSENYLTYGMGLGSMVDLTEKAKISLDLSANHIIQSSNSPRLNLLARADVAFRYHLNDHIGFFGGPSFNVYISEYSVDSENTALSIPYSLYEENWWNNDGSTSIWIGANAGVSIMF